MTVADYIANFLLKKGVDHVFGYLSSSILKVIDSIVGTKGIAYVQNFNEQASGLCACAYANIKNDVCVAITGAGPGGTNLITGIAEAYCSSIPVLFIVGQTNLKYLTWGKRMVGMQGLNIVDIVKPITKYAVSINEPKKIRYELEKAYYIAMSGRKGPVLLELPLDIQFEEISENHLEGFSPRKAIENGFLDLKDVICAIESAQRPVLLAGGGIRSAGCTDAFKCFVKKTRIPVVTTLNGIDAIDGAYGFTGLYGHVWCNKAVEDADLLLAIGVRFGISNVKGWDTNAKVIRVEIDENEIGSFIREDLVIKADAKVFLERFNGCTLNTDFSDWHRQLVDWRIGCQSSVYRSEDGVDPIIFVQEMQQYYKDNTIVTTDVGLNQMYVARGYQQKNCQRFLTSANLGVMGYSLPVAIGASYLVNSSIIAYMGDGGLQMNLQELGVLSTRRNNIKCVIFNNNALGMMCEIQDVYYDGRHCGSIPPDFTCPDLQKLADCFRLKYVRIENRRDFFKLKDVFADNEPWIIEVISPPLGTKK